MATALALPKRVGERANQDIREIRPHGGVLTAVVTH
jgi:hypothetical protein